MRARAGGRGRGRGRRHRGSHAGLLACAALLATAACGRERDASQPPADSTPAAIPAGPAAPAGATGASAAIAWSVSASRFGPLRAGMTLAEAGRVLGRRFSPPDSTSCAYVHPPGAPPGISLMVVNDTIARADVDSGGVRTTAGAAVGDSEASVMALYAGRVSVTPHKYTTGHYLVVTPSAPDDSTDRLVFETDGRKVVRYHAGRMPEVTWVEGCS